MLGALALVAGACFAVAPLPTALGVVGVGLLLRRSVRARVAAAVAVCLALGALRAARTLSHFDGERARARDAFGPPQRCALDGVVRSSPAFSEGRPIYVLSVDRADCESGRVTPGAWVRLGGGPDDLARNDRIAVVAQIAPIELLFNAELPNPLLGAARRRITLSGTALGVERDARGQSLGSWIDRLRAHARRRIARTFAPAAEPMARALVLGENDLDPDDDAAFRKSGLSHMLAVSGTHLVFAVLSLVRALGALLARVERLAARADVGRLAALAGAGLALLYADFAGGSGSAFRAAYMLAALLLARAMGRVGSPSRALGLSLALGWAFDPLVAFDISFLLSAAATAGLLLLGEPLKQPTTRLGSKLARFVGGAVATTLAAMLPCAPLLAVLSPDITLAGIFANVVAAPLGEAVALPLCLVHGLTTPLPWLEQGIALVASGALLLVRAIARESAAQTWLAVTVPAPTAFHLALIAVLAGKLVLGQSEPGNRLGWLRFWLLNAALGLSVIELAARRSGAPQGVLRMTALAVGQGDATLIDLPDGRLMLVDAGGSPAGGPDPGARVVVPALRARRRSRLDVVVLSHPHPDHFGGLLALARSVEIGEFWDTGHSAPDAAGPVYAELRRVLAARKVPVRGPAELCRAPRSFGRARLSVLAPCPGPVQGRDANDNSFVLKLEFGQRSLLLMGDAEASAERDLVTNHGSELAADVLKVGHHGSRTSSTEELLVRVRPRLATISCGVRNRFGHPVPMILDRLARFGARALRTDRDGAIEISTDGRDLRVGVAYSVDGMGANL